MYPPTRTERQEKNFHSRFVLVFRYQFEQLFLHWGAAPDSPDSQQRGRGGSEHSIDGYFFPAEIQIFGFNTDLFRNVSDAVTRPHGAVAIAVMVQEAETGSRGVTRGLRAITSTLKKVRVPLSHFDN